MASLTSTGLGSGLDINSIVEQLVKAERAPTANRLTQRESKANEELSALGKFKSALATFKDSLAKLTDAATFQGRTVTVQDDKVFTATAESTSLPGNYSVEVMNLAAAQRLRSIGFGDATSAIGTGTLAITVNGQTANIAIGSTASSLNDIRDAINESPDNPGVRATIVKASDGAHLIVSSTETGAANAITIAVSGGDGGLASFAYAAGAPSNPMLELQAAADANIVIDGFPVTSASNAISDAIDGVTIDLGSAKPGTILGLSVEYDPEGAGAAVQGFATAYNKLIDTVTELTRYNADTRDAAPLLGDATVRGIRDQLRREISTTLGTGAFNSLAAIGVTTETTGKLAVDATRLSAAIDDDFDAVGALFAGTSGLATRLEGIAEATLSRGSTITTREDALKTTLKTITSQRETLDERIERVRSRLLDQFNAMDALLGQLKNTSAFLSQQLG
ncbi:MAG: flagellar filament capping protein FliD [Gammaproteobacteria bacterium]|nr:flagellar filament capping protein FliD [Gammaproteobacteria bacterium]